LPVFTFLLTFPSSVAGTFANGGFEGDVNVPVKQKTRGGWEMTLTFNKPVKGFQVSGH